MREILEVIKEAVSKAEGSLKIASPWVDQCVLEGVLQTLSNNVKVEVILRSDRVEDLNITGEGTFRLLERYRSEIYLNEKLHAKLIIVDEKVAFVGSANLTRPGMEEGGNLEATIKVEGEEVEKLLALFEDYKKASLKLLPEAVGIVMSVESSTDAVAVLFEGLPEQSFLWVDKGKSRILCRLTRVYTQVNPPNPISSLYNTKAWLIAYLKTSLSKGTLLMGRVRVLFELKREGEGYFGTPLIGLSVGDQLLPVREKDQDLQKVMKTNLSGYAMDIPVIVGSLVGKGVPVYVDLAKITSMHLAVLGTTGSGKTTFVIRLLEAMPTSTAKAFVFDLFGEYAQKLKLAKERLLYIRIPNTLLPFGFDDLKETLGEYGLYAAEKGKDERQFFNYLRTYLKPDLEVSGYNSKGLKDLLLTGAKGILKGDMLDIIQNISKEMGEEALENQPEVFRLLKEALYSESDVVLIDLKDVANLNTRLNLVGVFLKEILYLARIKPSRWLLVLEEAHNFAPERGATDVPSGRENLAMNMTKRIALEGRKFGIGLVALSQRPANLSKYVLSQLNTQAIFRLITQNDIKAVSQFFEYPSEDQLRILPTLKPGHLFLSGIGVPFSMLVEIDL